MVLAALMILAAIVLPRLASTGRPTGARATRIDCINNLKQIGLSFRVWEGDYGDTYPMFVSQTNGGAMEYASGPNAWRQFLVMSNELTTPKILFCPAETDISRIQADAFTTGWQPNQRLFLSNSNLSYFVGIVSNEVNPQMILGGDHNITNGTAVKNGMLELVAANPTGWTADMHKNVGNLLLADGSVQQLNVPGLQNAVASSGVPTNLVQMPILGP
jgi:hypothetical protein